MDEVNDEMVAGYVGGCYVENGVVIHDPETGPGATCVSCEMLVYMIHGGDF